MNALGNKMMAKGVLRAFGLDEDQMEKAEEGWDKAPKKALVSTGMEISAEDRELLKQRAQGQVFDDYIKGVFEAAISEEINAAKAQSETPSQTSPTPAP